MQRLFSIFPNSWPGAGLLALRICAALPLIAGTVDAYTNVASPHWALLEVGSALIAMLFIAGFCTPIGAAGQVVIEMWLLFASRPFSTVAALSALVGISLFLLGPGAWSVDARLFGRRRIELPRD